MKYLSHYIQAKQTQAFNEALTDPLIISLVLRCV